MLDDDPTEWTFFTFENGPHEWYESADEAHPDDYVANNENEHSLVKDIYYRGKLIWTREKQFRPWNRARPRPASSEDPLF